MAEMTETPVMETIQDTDLVSAVRSALESSSEPLTLPKIRASLPPNLRSVTPEGLLEMLRRQAAANVFIEYPKYRSPHERFWDRPMEVHVACLLRSALEEKPLPWSELRRKLPDYAKSQAEPILEEQVNKGQLYRHPPLKSRTGPRFGLQPAEPREYLRGEFTQVFERLSKLGFSHSQLRESALELLHEEEWASPPPAPEASANPASEQLVTEETGAQQPAHHETEAAPNP